MDKHSLWQRYVPLVRHEALRLQVRLPASVELTICYRRAVSGY
jgi:RNA polymerase sigma factor for flagellar operon FliA